MGKYFDNFPTISYNGSFAKNLMSRVDFNDISKKSVVHYYPYTIADHDRIDNLSYNYYDNSDFAWLILLTNEIIDPYYDLPLTVDEFLAFITKKYGSVAVAQATIKVFRSNWLTDERILDAAGYSALPEETKKYWNPTYSYNELSVTYTRKKEDLFLATNKVMSVPFSAAVGTFVVGEIVSQPFGGGLFSTGVITNIDSVNHVLTINNYLGQFSAGTITGQTSTATATVLTIVDSPISSGGNTLQRNLTINEDIYWSPYYVYEYEYDLNESKRDIVLIDKAQSNNLENQVRQLLNS